MHSRFDGRAFDEADDHSLEKKLGIQDHLRKIFVLNARNVLEQVVEQNKQMDRLMNWDATEDDTIRNDGTEFTFTNDQLITMAEFFEEVCPGLVLCYISLNM